MVKSGDISRGRPSSRSCLDLPCTCSHVARGWQGLASPGRYTASPSPRQPATTRDYSTRQYSIFGKQSDYYEICRLCYLEDDEPVRRDHGLHCGVVLLVLAFPYRQAHRGAGGGSFTLKYNVSIYNLHTCACWWRPWRRPCCGWPAAPACCGSHSARAAAGGTWGTTTTTGLSGSDRD